MPLGTRMPFVSRNVRNHRRKVSLVVPEPLHQDSCMQRTNGGATAARWRRR